MCQKNRPQGAFHEHFSFFAANYSLNGAKSPFRPVLCKLDMMSLYKRKMTKKYSHFDLGLVELDKIHINAVITHFRLYQRLKE